MNGLAAMLTRILALLALVTFALGSYPVSTDVYRDLVFYFKYASSAYTLICPKPNGNILVQVFKNLFTETQGLIVRDDNRKEIVVTFRGSFSVADILTDVGIILTPFDSPGVVAPSGTLVHSGFLAGWNSVSIQVLSCVSRQLQAYPEYTLVTAGHSLGGSVASLAAMSFKANFPSANISMYTYGQPRTGNSVYADWVNNELGANTFRVVHTFDGVPTIIPAGKLPIFRDQSISFGGREYQHHGVEYWQNPDPASENTTVQCAAHGEDLNCSVSIPSTGVNLAHFAYFGIIAITPFCL